MKKIYIVYGRKLPFFWIRKPLIAFETKAQAEHYITGGRPMAAEIKTISYVRDAASDE